MAKDFQQQTWNAAIENDCRQLVRLAVHEDLAQLQDWTTIALIPEDRRGRAEIVSREEGVVCGIQPAITLLDEMDVDVVLEPTISDGASVKPGQTIATLDGNIQNMLTCERPLLNFMGRLSGIATLTQQFVQAIEGSAAKIYDTRKTTPGWRRLEKYAVHCGGGTNHRSGLYDAIMAKDNHLAFLPDESLAAETSRPVSAIERIRKFLAQAQESVGNPEIIVEIEVDSLEQLQTVLPAGPDIVLLDNMGPDKLREAIKLRNQIAPKVELEASGGINLDTVRAVAESGVERISAGALTHSATNFDVGLDWSQNF